MIPALVEVARNIKSAVADKMFIMIKFYSDSMNFVKKIYKIQGEKRL